MNNQDESDATLNNVAEQPPQQGYYQQPQDPQQGYYQQPQQPQQGYYQPLQDPQQGYYQPPQSEIYDGTMCPPGGYENTSSLGDQNTFVQGTEASNQEIYNNSDVTIRAAHPMKWYKALLAILWFGILGNAISAYLFFSGAIYSDFVDDVYEMLPTLKNLDISSSIYCIAMVIFAFIVWLQLKKYKKHAPKLLIAIYLLNTIYSIIYMVTVYAIVGGAETTIIYGDYYLYGGKLYREYLDLSQLSFSASNIVAIIVSIFMAIVNFIYFRNRKDLFVN